MKIENNKENEELKVHDNLNAQNTKNNILNSSKSVKGIKNSCNTILNDRIFQSPKNKLLNSEKVSETIRNTNNLNESCEMMNLDENEEDIDIHNINSWEEDNISRDNSNKNMLEQENIIRADSALYLAEEAKEI